jgi:hypothetical protein
VASVSLSAIVAAFPSTSTFTRCLSIASCARPETIEDRQRDLALRAGQGFVDIRLAGGPLVVIVPVQLVRRRAADVFNQVPSWAWAQQPVKPIRSALGSGVGLHTQVSVPVALITTTHLTVSDPPKPTVPTVTVSSL